MNEINEILFVKGANVNLCQHEHGYTALHFAGLSGNQDICHLLLLSGAKVNMINTVGRTAAQMAAFVGNHGCVAIINNFVPKSDVQYYTVPQGLQKDPLLPSVLSDSFHSFIMQINIHPIRVALNIQKYVLLFDHLSKVKKVLELMCEREMKRSTDSNEVMAFKFHYLGYIIGEIIKCKGRQSSAKKEEDEKRFDFIDLLARKLLKINKEGNLDIMDTFLKECIREFPYRECTIFRQMVTSLAGQDPPSTLNIITSVINGQRGFNDNITVCNTCGEEKPSKKCSKCKAVQYCDRECQRLHWFMHKKSCARLGTAEISEKPSTSDTASLSQVKNLLVKN